MNYNTYEEPRVIPQEIVEQELYRLCVVEWRDGDIELVAFDDRDSSKNTLKNYNKTWRAWTNNPSESLREWIKWDSEEEEE